MTRLLRAEALRLATTRASWLLAAGATALIAGGIAATAAATSFTPGISPARSVLAIAGLAQTVALLAGVLSVTGEFRHKTITPAVLITPRRTPLLAAKLITLAAAGLVFGLAATAIATAITLPLLAARHIPAGVTGSGVAAIIAGGGIATALSAAIGVGVGAIIRNQAGAIIAVLALLYVAEPLLGFIPHLGTAIQQYGLGGLAAATTHTIGFPASAHLLSPASRGARARRLRDPRPARRRRAAEKARHHHLTTHPQHPRQGPARPHHRRARPTAIGQREIPARAAGRARVLIGRVPRGEGMRMSSEPATVTAPPAGQAFGCTVQALRNTMQERARHGSRRRDTQPAISDLPFPRRPRPACRCVGCSAPGYHVGSPPGACARGRTRPACPALRQEARALGRPHLSRRNAHSGAVLRATPCRDLCRPQPGVAPAGRIDTAASGRGGAARLVPAWMDQGRNGISP